MSKKVAQLPPAPSLDLTPIMNMVLCLIPLMLLSVVFMTITVIDASMPERSAGAAANDGEPPKRLQLFISKQGFTIVTDHTHQGIDGCPPDGPTICLQDPDKELPVDTYNWRALYNALFDIKSDGAWSDIDQITIVADSSVNYGVIVKAMDVSRYQLVPRSEHSDATKGKKLLSDEVMDDALPVTVEKVVEGKTSKASLDMFPVVILGLPTMQ